MIIGDKTQDGKLISELTINSGRKILRQCDRCGEQKWIIFREMRLSREKKKETKDFCFKCTRNKGKDPSQLMHHRNVDGYIKVRKDNQFIYKHREIVERFIGRQLQKQEKIHHVDSNKGNIYIDNLCLFGSDSEHQKCHKQLEKIAFELVEMGAILFDRNNKKYYIDNKIRTEYMEKSIGFEAVEIKQNKNICLSRTDAKITSEIIRGICRPIPIIASNMSSVVNSDFCIQLYKLGAFAFMHRAFKNPEDYISEIKKISKECDLVGASIGVDENAFDLSKQLIENGANILVIDIAHGYDNRVINLCKQIKKAFKGIKVVVGNTINPDMVLEIFDYADAIKIGIGQGLSCLTAHTAGCTAKQWSVIRKFQNLCHEVNLPIISDGGIRSPADFTKSIGAGASSVMAGSIFCRCPESAGEIIEVDGKLKKSYSGMASRIVQEKWKGRVSNDCPEGKTVFLDLGEPAEKLLARYAGALRSGISYAGFNNIEDFRKGCEFILLG